VQGLPSRSARLGPMTTRLIFVEGMPGAGKSTTAQNLGRWLSERGESCRAYHEMDDDNPIRTRGTDAMRANHPHVKPLPDVGPAGFAVDPGVYAMEQWSRLANRCANGEWTCVLESRYIQNAVQPRFMAGASPENVEQRFAQIYGLVAPAAPLLVYLRNSDVSRAIRETLAQRGEPWATWLKENFTRMPWARERDLEGEAAVIGFYEAWEQIAARLCELHRGPKHIVEDAQRDWPEALQQIFAAVRSPEA